MIRKDMGVNKHERLFNSMHVFAHYSRKIHYEEHKGLYIFTISKRVEFTALQ
jgi:hypothetical protein